MRKLIVLATVLLSSAARASAATPSDETCAAYVGTTVQPLAFDVAAAPFKSIRPKGEFETAVAYQARLNQISAKPIILAAKVDNRSEAFPYDADTGTLQIKRWAFEGEALLHHNAVWGPGGPLWNVNAVADEPDDATENIEAVLSHFKTLLGSYRASNAFGATTRVFRYEDVIDLVFDRVPPHEGFVSRGLFSNVTTDDVIGTLSVPPERARSFRTSLKTAFVIVPKFPYFVFGRDHHSPTFDAANDTTTVVKVLFANMKCGLVTDGGNRVLGSYTIR